MSNPRIMIAATKSGTGKTSITCGLLQALKERNFKVSAFKCGPDYIDPMFHKKVIGVPSKNLDLFFANEELTKALFLKENKSDISVIEGVMGLYDGVGGTTQQASTYHLASVLETPIILVVDARGMGCSLLAEIGGFLGMDKNHLIKGVILNRISGMFYQTIKPLIEETLGVTVVGYLPQNDAIGLESRYLGLKLPEEVNDLKEKTKSLASEMEKTIGVDRLLTIAKEAPVLQVQKGALEYPIRKRNLSIGIARDEAFCFYYEENLSMLEEAGVTLIPFSPLKDQGIPKEIDGLIFGGGYPELYAKQLETNSSMRKSVKNSISNGMPVFAECGGFMYLHEYLIDEKGNIYQMAGVISGKCFYQKKMKRFGYISIYENEPKYLTQSPSVRGHEFHYYESDNNGTDCKAVKPNSKRSWECIHKTKNGWMGYAHLYFPSAPEFVDTFLGDCEMYKNIRNV